MTINCCPSYSSKIDDRADIRVVKAAAGFCFLHESSLFASFAVKWWGRTEGDKPVEPGVVGFIDDPPPMPLRQVWRELIMRDRLGLPSN